MHTATRADFEQLIDVWAPVGQLGTGFTFTEGPIWHPRDHYLLFSDMPADVRRRWDAQRGVQEVMRPSNKCNGMTYDADLNLVVCEHSTSTVVREFPDGRRETLASHFNGVELNSPNDLCIKSDGAIYFSDPWYGRMPGYGIERPRLLGFQGVFRIPPGGGPARLVVDRGLFAQPNGLCFSPDELCLYVNDTEKAEIRVFDVKADGSLSSGRLFASGIRSQTEPGVPDGMKCDRLGNIWVTAPGGIWVYASSGELIGKVRIPELAANLHWGGDSFETLFIAATHSVYTVKTRVGGRLEPFMVPQNKGNTVVTFTHATSVQPPAVHPPVAPSDGASDHHLTLDVARCALIIMDMQNDVMMDGGAFASTGAAQHCREQNAVENARRLAEAARARGVTVIHVWNIVEPGAVGLPMNAPLFEGVADANALVRGSWGAAPAPGLEPQQGDILVEKARMSAWEGTRLETVLRSGNRDTIIVTGAWTNMSVEHTSRTGADKGYVMIVADDACSTMNADWHNASINYALTQVAAVTKVDDVIRAWSSAGC
jgi:gluconolactonase